MLDEKLVRLGVKAKSSKEVIQLLGDVLARYGYVKDSWIQAVIDREEAFPTGLNMPGDDCNIAIPHTDVDHVLKPGVAVAILAHPVTFIHMATDDQLVPVELVFALAISDPKQVIDSLKRIVTALQKPELRQQLKKATSPKEVVGLLNRELGSMSSQPVG